MFETKYMMKTGVCNVVIAQKWVFLVGYPLQMHSRLLQRRTYKFLLNNFFPQGTHTKMTVRQKTKDPKSTHLLSNTLSTPLQLNDESKTHNGTDQSHKSTNDS